MEFEASLSSFPVERGANRENDGSPRPSSSSDSPVKERGMQRPSYLRFVRSCLPKERAIRPPALSPSSFSRSSSSSSSSSRHSSSCSSSFDSSYASAAHPAGFPRVRRDSAPLSQPVWTPDGGLRGGTGRLRLRASGRGNSSASIEEGEEDRRSRFKDEERRKAPRRRRCLSGSAKGERGDDLIGDASSDSDVGGASRQQADLREGRRFRRRENPSEERRLGRHESRGGRPDSHESRRGRARRSRSTSQSAGRVYSVDSDSSEEEKQTDPWRRSRGRRATEKKALPASGDKATVLSPSSTGRPRSHSPHKRSRGRMRSVESSPDSLSPAPHSEADASSESEERGASSKRRERSPSLPPPAPRNPLFAAYDRESYQKLKRRRREASDTRRGRRHHAGKEAHREQWRHDRFHERSPSPQRVRPPTVWNTRKGQWRSLAGGVYVPPSMEEVEELKEELSRYRPSPRGYDRSPSKPERRRRTSDDSSLSPVRRGSPVYE
ncbi:hypothetical protein TGCAST_272190 [Toxoplasma gondii CAST]|uniref:Uncharacterized protein n=1 Tax=Toxoplasma gondii CAST TaxID=943122 RepID=A0A425I918_TOXGO|nr:hypothetical protein TGCAST_272190 [Toxoplasma gondii CAST]